MFVMRVYKRIAIINGRLWCVYVRLQLNYDLAMLYIHRVETAHSWQSVK